MSLSPFAATTITSRSLANQILPLNNDTKAYHDCELKAMKDSKTSDLCCTGRLEMELEQEERESSATRWLHGVDR